MNKPRQAKLTSCLKFGDKWVAADSTGRKFLGDTKEEAIQMLNEYNHIKAKPSEEPKS